MPLVEGQNAFTYWALSSYGDSSHMGEETDLVDTLSPSLSGEVSGTPGENGWWVSQATLSSSVFDPSPGSGLATFEISVDGAGWIAYTAPIVLDEGQHVVQLRATDNAGHLAETTQTVWVDTQPPQSVFTDPPEGSEIWVAGVLDTAGASADVTSGLAIAEISYDGGGIWQAVDLNPDGTWSSNWDTRSVPNGTYTVQARAKDVAGNLESTAQIIVHVDNGNPKVSIPGSWYIWEPVPIKVADSGIGVDKVKLTIHGGSYGNRTYTWKNPALVPDDFIWDRHFGDIVAPIGDYSVTVEAWDDLRNRGVDTGMILIPDPGPQAVSTPTASPTALSSPPPPSPTMTIITEAKPLISQPSPTATTRPAVAMSFGDQDETDGAASTTEKVEPTTSPSGGASGLLWGTAALAAAGAATAYALSRRRAREAALAEKRRRAARESSPAARKSRLQRLWQQAQARVAPIRSAMRAAAAAATAAAAKAARRAEERRREREERLLSQQHRRSELTVEVEPTTAPVDTYVAWQQPDPDLQATYRLGHIYTSTATPPTATATSTPPGYQGSPTETSTPTTSTTWTTPVAVRAPYPPGFAPTYYTWPQFSGTTISQLGRLAKIGKSGFGAYQSWPLRFITLESGKVAVRISDAIPAGEKLVRRLKLGYRGTRYNVGTIASTTAGNLLRKAAKNAGLVIPFVTSLASNIYNFGWGSSRATGVWSNEFAASTMVDFGIAGGIGIGSALTVGGGIALATAAGLTAAATLPLAVVIGLTVGAGFAVGALVDHIVDTDALKQKVADGLSAWGGIAENVSTIANVAVQRTGEAVTNMVQNVSGVITNTVQEVNEAVSDIAEEVIAGAKETIDTVVDVVQQVGQSVSNAVDSTASAVKNLFSGLFGDGN